MSLMMVLFIVISLISKEILTYSFNISDSNELYSVTYNVFSIMIDTIKLYTNYCFPDKQKHISTLVVDEINTMMIYFTPKTFLQNLTVHAYVT